jgi:hypothetical protein
MLEQCRRLKMLPGLKHLPDESRVGLLETCFEDFKAHASQPIEFEE